MAATAEIQPVAAPKPAPAAAAPAAPAVCAPVNVRWQWGSQADGSPLAGVITVTDAKTPQEAIEIVVAHFRRRCAIYVTPAPEPSPKPKPDAKPADKPKKKPMSPNKSYGRLQTFDGDVIDVTRGEPGLSPVRK